MTPRKARNSTTQIGQSKQKVVLMGDVRQAPVEVMEGSRSVRPVVALWVNAEDGYIVRQLMDEPGHPAETLVRALWAPVPVPGQPRIPTLPSRVILFDDELASQVKPLLAALNIETLVSPPFEPLDALFADLFGHLQQTQLAGSMLDLPDEVLRPLISPAERLWRAKPWEYTFDYPSFSLVPQKENARPLHASILGANEEVFGVALYASVEDYEATLDLGESTIIGLPPEVASPAEVEAAATEVLGAIRHRAFLVSFDPKDEAPPSYRSQLAKGGWPGRLSKVPLFSAMGGGAGPGTVDGGGSRGSCPRRRCAGRVLPGASWADHRRGVPHPRGRRSEHGGGDSTCRRIGPRRRSIGGARDGVPSQGLSGAPEERLEEDRRPERSDAGRSPLRDPGHLRLGRRSPVRFLLERQGVGSVDRVHATGGAGVRHAQCAGAPGPAGTAAGQAGPLHRRLR